MSVKKMAPCRRRAHNHASVDANDVRRSARRRRVLSTVDRTRSPPRSPRAAPAHSQRASYFENRRQVLTKLLVKDDGMRENSAVLLSSQIRQGIVALQCYAFKVRRTCGRKFFDDFIKCFRRNLQVKSFKIG